MTLIERISKKLKKGNIELKVIKECNDKFKAELFDNEYSHKTEIVKSVQPDKISSFVNILVYNFKTAKLLKL